MDDIYMLSDTIIRQRIGNKIKSCRLRRNITQASIAKSAGVSLSTVKKIESGEIGSFDSLVRLLRTLGILDIFQPLIEEDQLSPSEYYEFVNSAKKKTRKRAAGQIADKRQEEPEW